MRIPSREGKGSMPYRTGSCKASMDMSLVSQNFNVQIYKHDNEENQMTLRIIICVNKPLGQFLQIKGHITTNIPTFSSNNASSGRNSSLSTLYSLLEPSH